jgi:hypothetical protein
MPVPSKVTKQGKAPQTASSRSSHPATPPDSPTSSFLNPLEFAQQVIDTVKLIQTSDRLLDLNPKGAPSLQKHEPEVHSLQPTAAAFDREVWLAERPRRKAKKKGQEERPRRKAKKKGQNRVPYA